MAQAFVEPDFERPLQLAERLVGAGERETVKGMFFQSAVEQAKAASGRVVGRERYVSFKDYPLREWLQVLPEAAALIYPRVSPREAMRRLGQKAYPTFVGSMVGRVLMNLGGIGFDDAVKLVPRIYALTGSAGVVTVREHVEGRAVIELRGIWDWPDAWQVGVFEGGAMAFKKQPRVRIRNLSLADADLELSWT